MHRDLTLHRYSASEPFSRRPYLAFGLELPGRSPWLARDPRFGRVRSAFEHSWAIWNRLNDEYGPDAPLDALRHAGPSDHDLELVQDRVSFQTTPGGRLLLQFPIFESGNVPDARAFLALLQSRLSRSARVTLRRHRPGSFEEKLSPPLQLFHVLPTPDGHPESIRLDLPARTRLDDVRFADSEPVKRVRPFFVEAVAHAHVQKNRNRELIDTLSLPLHLHDSFFIRGAVDLTESRTKVLRYSNDHVSLIHPLPPARAHETFEAAADQLADDFKKIGLVVHAQPK